MKRKTGIVAIVLIAALAGGWLAWNNLRNQANEPAPAQGSQTGVAVTTTLAQRQTQPVVLEANGYVTPVKSVEIHPQISNVISRVHIKEGQFVKAGELMFTLDERSDQANLLKAEAQLAKDRATLADFERQFARQKELRQKGFVSQGATDTIQSQLEAQQATLRADQAALEGARVSLSFDALRAPIGGRVGAIDVYPGTLVQPNSGPLVTITQLDPIHVSFTLPERELASLQAAAKNSGVSILAALPNSSWQREGRLSFIDNAVDTQSGTIRLKGLFANADHALWPGAYVSIRISVRELKDVVVVPLAAIVHAVDGTHLYTVSADQTVQRRKITILHNFSTRAGIQGIESGERVVVDGTQSLRPGMRVRQPFSASPTAPATNKPASPSQPADNRSP